MSKVEIINNVQIEVVSKNDTFLVSNKDVAKAFGVGESAIRNHKGRSEFTDGKHFISVTSSVSGGTNKTMWTKRGIIRLGFKLQETTFTIAFRDWAEDYIINGGEVSKPLTFEEMAKQTIALADQRIKELEHKIIEDKPLTDFGKAISQSTGTVKVGDWIKAINDSGDIAMGRNKAFKWFRSSKYLQKDNMPYQRYIDNGLFEVKEGLVVTDTKQIPTFTTLLTAKGQMFFAKKLKEIA